MKSRLVIISVLATLAAISYGYREFYRPVESLKDQKSDISIESNDLLTAFTVNEAVANEKYNDKVIEVRGKVQKIEKTEEKNAIYLKTADAMAAVICEMEKGQSVDNFTEDSLVTIKGKCTGYLMDVVLVQCVVKK